MAVSPPFVINEAKPASTDLISQHPADERAFRDVVESWLTFISDPATGLIKTSALGVGGLTLTSTDAGAGAGPILALDRNSASPADNDNLGLIRFTARNSAAETTTAGGIFAQWLDVTDGTEDSLLMFQIIVGGTTLNKMYLDSTGLNVVNGLSLGTALSIANGGTGATTAAAARTALGLGTMATQNSSAVSISGGTATLTTLTATTVNGGSLTLVSNVMQGSAGIIIRPVSGSSLNDTTIFSNGDMSVEGSITAEDTVAGTNLSTTGNPVGSTWSPWGSTSAFTAISARIEARAAAYADAAVTSSTVGAAIAAGAATQIGTYIMAKRTTNVNTNFGDNIAGTLLNYTTADGGAGTAVGFGTWSCQGKTIAGGSSAELTTIWRRVA